jgi:hypothetical protein
MRIDIEMIKDQIDEMIEEDPYEAEETGVCLNCGEFISPCEPDAEDNYCDECGEYKVMSIFNFLLNY